jgi:glycerol uptake facilitator-like aquaporin
VIATSAIGGKTGKATITLCPPPWAGPWRNALGIYLVAVFLTGLLLIGLWPQSQSDAGASKQIEASTKEDKKAETPKTAQPVDTQTGSANAPQSQADKDKDAAKTKTSSAGAGHDNAQQDKKEPANDAKQKQATENNAGEGEVKTMLGLMLKDTNLMLLVLLGGVLGSFLHSARSYADFVGNRQMKGSWAWWYFLHPFMGAALALIFYMALRGGFLAVTGGASKSEISPYGVTSIAALVGMFSKQATLKLADVFETLFKSDKSNETKDQLHNSNTPAAGTNQSSTPIGGGTK